MTDVINESEYTYRLECEDGGSGANGWTGDLMCLDDVEGLEDAQLTKLLVEGVDEEDEESYRMRLMDSFEIKPFAGNRKYYIQEIGKIDGVGGVKIYRRTGTTISAVIVTDEYRKPDGTLVDSVQEQVDPKEQHSEGVGIAPIGHYVTVAGADEYTVNVSASLTCETGYTIEGLKTSIENAIDTYLLDLKKKWADLDHVVVRNAGIENAIYNVEGIEDIKNVLINGVTGNITLDQNTIPVKGTITCS